MQGFSLALHCNPGEENVNFKLHPYRYRLWRKEREMASAASGRSNGDNHLKALSLQVQITRRKGEGKRWF
jgi:hypothetical protein